MEKLQYHETFILKQQLEQMVHLARKAQEASANIENKLKFHALRRDLEDARRLIIDNLENLDDAADTVSNA
jgi:hypothetical protein